MEWKLKDIAEAVSGKIVNQQPAEITGVQFDSRKISENELFVPIIADRDGHDFIKSAMENGAGAAFWSKSEAEVPKDFPVILVEDTFEALRVFAKWHLKQVNPTVVGVTGSNGKTTTKDMTAAVLAQKYQTHKTEGNYNNQIGLPMTVLSMPEDTEAVVLEMGMDKPGEIHALSTLAEPDLAVITMIGESHIEFFGSRAKIADTKMEIVDGLKDNGTFIYNGDEPLLESRAMNIQNKKTFGQTDSADIYPSEIDGGTRATTFKTNLNFDMDITIPTPGKYNVQNALAATLAGVELGLSLDEIKAGLESFKLTKNRLQWINGLDKSFILNDAYNASPSSMKAVLEYFSTISIKGKKIVVLGDILELGDLSKELHQSLSSSLLKEPFDFVVLYGNQMKYLYESLEDKLPKEKLIHFSGDKSQMVDYLKQTISSEDAVLIKSSFGTDLLSVVDALKDEK